MNLSQRLKRTLLTSVTAIFGIGLLAQSASAALPMPGTYKVVPGPVTQMGSLKVGRTGSVTGFLGKAVQAEGLEDCAHTTFTVFGAGASVKARVSRAGRFTSNVPTDGNMSTVRGTFRGATVTGQWRTIFRSEGDMCDTGWEPFTAKRAR